MPKRQKKSNVTEKKIVVKKEPRKRTRSSGQPSKMYFDDTTQASIEAYQDSQVKRERESIYVTKIMPSFEKLVENLINIHKFSRLHDTYDDLKHDCVCFLFETINKFDRTRGTKAFSYFNVVAKHWLIMKTKQKSLDVKRYVSMDDSESLSLAEMKLIDDHCSLQSQDVALEKKDMSLKIVKMLMKIREFVKTENELICINSIITVFENIENLDILSKTAVMLYIRELSGLSQKQMATALQTIKKYYEETKENDGIDTIFAI